MSTDILMPMFYMVVLTSVVFLFNVLIRLKDVLVDKGHTGSELMKIPIPSSANDLIKQADRNLINLFEFPILFYAVCIAIYMTGRVDPLFFSLAYSFVGLRVAHSLYHIFVNGFIGPLPIRALLFVPSWAIIVWMWGRLVFST
jgi:hypothetical protein